jgi:hypothetical protein
MDHCLVAARAGCRWASDCSAGAHCVIDEEPDDGPPEARGNSRLSALCRVRGGVEGLILRSDDERRP